MIEPTPWILWVRDNVPYPYFLGMSAVVCGVLFWVDRRAPKHHLSSQHALDFVGLALAVGLVGARLWHVLWEAPALYLAHPSLVLQFWNGGFVFFGGALPATLAVFWLVRRRGESWKNWLDFFTPVVLTAYGVGRIIGTVVGSSHGYPTDFPFHVVYPEGFEAPAGVALLPVAVFEGLWSLAIAVVLAKWTRLQRPVGTLAKWGLLLHGIGRCVAEIFRADPRGSAWGGITLSFAVAGILATAAGISLLAQRYRSHVLWDENPGGPRAPDPRS